MIREAEAKRLKLEQYTLWRRTTYPIATRTGEKNWIEWCVGEALRIHGCELVFREPKDGPTEVAVFGPSTLPEKKW